MEDKETVNGVLVNYHCMVKPKAAMDQFIEGLDRLEVTRLVRTHPTLAKSLFVNMAKVLTGGIY